MSRMSMPARMDTSGVRWAAVMTICCSSGL
jgi:hypothetical protein